MCSTVFSGDFNSSDDLENTHAWPSCQPRDDQNSLEKILHQIETVQDRVKKIKIQLDELLTQNAGKFSSMENLSLLEQSDWPSSSARSPNVSQLDGDAMPLGALYSPPHHMSECDFRDLVFSESEFSCDGQGTAPDIIESTMGPIPAVEVHLDEIEDSCESLLDEVLKHTKTAEKGLNDIEKISGLPIEKLQAVVKEEKDTTDLPSDSTSKPESTVEAKMAQDQSVLNSCLASNFLVPKNKRKRDHCKARLGAWNAGFMEGSVDVESLCSEFCLGYFVQLYSDEAQPYYRYHFFSEVSAGLLGFFFVKTWSKFLERSGMLRQPFTRQENNVIQTCVVATSGITFSGGFGSYLLCMSESIAKQATEANDYENIKNPRLGWMIGFLFVVSFIGLFSVLPLRKIMIIDYKLVYPSGTATALLINSFHTPQGAKLAKKQVKALGKFFSFSFFWGFFQWFFATEDGCGFRSFPTFGLKAYDNTFYFDFSATYVGVGMICPHIINVSVLVGAILSWGIMWPLIETKEGDWYPRSLPHTNLHGLQGYKVFIAIAMILGDGLYNFVKVMGRTIFALVHQFRNDSTLPTADKPSHITPSMSFDDRRRTQLFLKDQISSWVAASAYIALCAVSIATLHYTKELHL